MVVEVGEFNLMPSAGTLSAGEFVSTVANVGAPDDFNQLTLFWSAEALNYPEGVERVQCVFELWLGGAIYTTSDPVDLDFGIVDTVPGFRGMGSLTHSWGELQSPGLFECNMYLHFMGATDLSPMAGTADVTVSGDVVLYFDDGGPPPPDVTVVEAPAIPESLMGDLRNLFQELVTDSSTGNDRLISIRYRVATAGENGERTYAATELQTVYGQATYTTQSAATRALGRPTAERVVKITLPYSAPFSPDYTYVVDDVEYSPIPGENNLGTSYRAYVQFLAKRRD